MESETICHYCGEKLPHEKCSDVKKPDPTEWFNKCCELQNALGKEHQQVKELQAQLTAKDDVLRKIKDWCRAYPLEVFPKPDKEYFAKAHAILKQNELSLTRISADNMRHVLVGIQKIIEGEAKDV